MKICRIGNCDEELSARSRLPFCKLCRASIGNWTRRPTGELLQRMTRLSKYQARMKTISIEDMKPARRTTKVKGNGKQTAAHI